MQISLATVWISADGVFLRIVPDKSQLIDIDIRKTIIEYHQVSYAKRGEQFVFI